MSYYGSRSQIVPFSTLVGKTIISAAGAAQGSETVVFTCEDGSVFQMDHTQDCCEAVEVEDVIGDIEDLIGHPILLAEEVSDEGDPLPKPAYSDESHTWTFYKLSTIRGSVTIRWYGSSNGYYSEEVDFRQIASAGPTP